jgi:phage baseplate assembly protein W
MGDVKSFLGTGWSFPPTFDLRRGNVDMVSDEKDIRQSIEIILFTNFRERVMKPEFGSSLQDYVFETLDSVTINRMKDVIRYAILDFEPRVKLKKISLEIDQTLEGRLNINLDILIVSVNVRTNIVYPFYFKEGTNVVGM